MEALGAILALLGLVSFIAIIKPFGPYKKRWQALIGAIALCGIGGALMPDAPTTPQSSETPVAAPATIDNANAAVSEAPTGPSELSSRWRYERQRDEMRNANTDRACLASTNELEFAFPYQGGSRAEICFRQSPQYGFDAWIRVERGQFTCFMDCVVRVKFDDGEVQSFSAGGASDGSSDIVFVSNAERFLTATKRASQIIVEAEFFQAGSHQMVFERAQDLEWPQP